MLSVDPAIAIALAALISALSTIIWALRRKP